MLSRSKRLVQLATLAHSLPDEEEQSEHNSLDDKQITNKDDDSHGPSTYLKSDDGNSKSDNENVENQQAWLDEAIIFCAKVTIFLKMKSISELFPVRFIILFYINLCKYTVFC